MALEAVRVGRWSRQVVWVLGRRVLPKIYRLVVRGTGLSCVFFLHGAALLIVIQIVR